jgi:hypothetical protein
LRTRAVLLPVTRLLDSPVLAERAPDRGRAVGRDSIVKDDRVEFHTALARSVVRMVEAADRSLVHGGREVSLDHGDVGEQLAARRELAFA